MLDIAQLLPGFQYLGADQLNFGPLFRCQQVAATCLGPGFKLGYAAFALFQVLFQLALLGQEFLLGRQAHGFHHLEWAGGLAPASQPDEIGRA